MINAVSSMSLNIYLNPGSIGLAPNVQKWSAWIAQPMKKFFSSNIGTAGRILRALWAIGLFVAARWLRDVSIWLSLGLAFAGVFALFEALRSWCILRACGIKTRY
jgi:hypothetical protein